MPNHRGKRRCQHAEFIWTKGKLVRQPPLDNSWRHGAWAWTNLRRIWGEYTRTYHNINHRALKITIMVDHINTTKVWILLFLGIRAGTKLESRVKCVLNSSGVYDTPNIGLKCGNGVGYMQRGCSKLRQPISEAICRHGSRTFRKITGSL